MAMSPQVAATIRDKRALQALMTEFAEERQHQADQWSTGSLDDLNAADDAKIQLPDTWCMWFMRHLGTWNGYRFPYQYDAESLQSFRAAMVKVAATAIAAIMWTDRKLDK